MIASHRKNFNDSFTEAKHLAYLTALNSHYPGALDFSVAETPIFIDKIFIDKVLATGNYITEQIQSPSFKTITEASLQNQPNTPNEPALPNCIVMDFALAINDNKEIVPALIELQGFPSLFAFEVLQDECIRNTYSIPAGFSPFLNGYSKEKYLKHLEQVIKGDPYSHENKHTVLLEILPHQQKTRIDFYCTEDYLNVPIVCITEIFKEGTTLYYNRNEKKIKIDRIYNRVVLDELKNQTKSIQEQGAILQSELNVEWVTHPNHFFRISKFLLPFLTHPFIPKTQFVHELPSIPTDLENYILKPLFSFAGQGVVIDIQPGDMEKLKNPTGWILQEKVTYANCIETPTGPAKAELRVFYFWDAPTQQYIATMNLARLSKGKMIGVNYNKTATWVGGSLAYFETN
jgi:hypothetical protein